MKLFSDYINESYSKKLIKELKVVYDFPHFKLKIDVPETYEESDIQQYLDDYLLNNLPADPNIGKKAFGINFDFLSDAYFEYSRYDVLTKKLDDVDLTWNKDYSNENIDDDERIITAILYNFKYIMRFDKFQVKYDKDVKKTLNDLFVAYESNDINKYPIEFKYNKKELSYKE